MPPNFLKQGVGYDVDDLVRDLVKAADGDTELAQYGIVYVDEIDKIAAEASSAGGMCQAGVYKLIFLN